MKLPNQPPAPRHVGAPHANPGRVITLKSARRACAERQTIAPAECNADGKQTAPRKRTRKHRGMSFRMWARNEFGGRSRGTLSPKLVRIVHGAE